MDVLTRVLMVLVGVLLLACAGTAWADDDDDDDDERPEVAATAASQITSSGALLSATVDPNGRSTTYKFQYGPMPAYGSLTPQASAGSSSQPTPVSATLTGLEPSKTYHFRVIATNSKGTTVGP